MPVISHKNNQSCGIRDLLRPGVVVLAVLLSIFLPLQLRGETSGAQGRQLKKPCIGVTIFPLFDVVRRVAGDRFSVIQLLPSGRSEHVFDPAPGDIVKVQNCRAFYAMGLGLDPWVQRVASAAGGKGRPAPRVIEFGTSANPLPLRMTMPLAVSLLTGDQISRDREIASLDPHLWLDPVRWEMVVARVGVELAQIDPEGSKEISARAQAVGRSVLDSHARFVAVAAKWRKKSVVTVHGAFGYFALRYNLKIPAVIELIPGHQPSAKYIAQVLATVKKESVGVVLAEPQLDNRMMKMIASETGAKLVTVDPLGGVVPNDSWEQMMDRLMDALTGALQ